MANKNSKAEETWVGAERDKVTQYLGTQGVDHLGVGEWPAFHVRPCFAVWAVQSKKFPGAVGWWAISGDGPTDYMSSADAKRPRDALAHFAKQWAELSDGMLRGVSPAGSKVGRKEDWPKLAPLLKSRSEFLSKIVADDSAWGDR